MGGHEQLALQIEEIRLKPGDRIRITTEMGLKYDIEAGGAEKGSLRSTVVRRAIKTPKLKVPEQTHRDAIIVGQTVDMITCGERIEVTGINARTGEMDTFRTSPVAAIDNIEHLPIDPDKWQLKAAVSGEPRSPREAINQ